MSTSSFFKIGSWRGRTLFKDPGGRAFFSIGMNHVASEALRHPEQGDLWQSRYGGSEIRWLQDAVRPDLEHWGFNTLGWNQEVVIRSPTMHRHSRSFTFEEYQALDLPYCHLLPFAELHQWERETRYPDFSRPEFEEWCDYVAREWCGRMRDDPRLIGYFYADCPAWVHTFAPSWASDAPNPKGPIYPPERLDTEDGRKELYRIAEHYYRVTHEAVRRYDPHHLILGDRLDGAHLVPDEIIRAAAPYVDVLSFQYFAEPDRIRSDFQRWSRLAGRPVLLADAIPPRADPVRYAEMLAMTRDLPECLGWHVCGAYLTNRTRRYGFRLENEDPNDALIAAATDANHAALKHFAEE